MDDEMHSAASAPGSTRAATGGANNSARRLDKATAEASAQNERGMDSTKHLVQPSGEVGMQTEQEQRDHGGRDPHRQVPAALMSLPASIQQKLLSIQDDNQFDKACERLAQIDKNRRDKETPTQQ